MSRSNKQMMSLSDTFSGGIFLAAALIHILPDAQDAFDVTR